MNQVNILHIRALVKADVVVLFDTYGSVDSRLHSVFLYHLEVRTSLYLRLDATKHRFHSITCVQRRLGRRTSFGEDLTRRCEEYSHAC